MPTPLATVKLTYEDYLGFPEDGKRHELIDGDHYVTPAPDLGHQSILVYLSRLLLDHVLLRNLGWVWPAPVDVVLSEIDVVQPDLVFLSRERAQLRQGTHLAGAPDLVVEVLSASTRRRDEITKRHLYEKHGVAEYWVIDPELETVKIYRRNEGRFERAAELARERGDALTTPLLAGLKIPLSEIFRDS